MNKNKYEINVLINGKPVKEYFHNNRFYLEAKNGSDYSIKLKNHSHKKIMAVLSVDGIEVLKGGNASEAESGYIINPFSSIEIKGYRIDDNNVATFKFSDGKTSYATKVEQKFDEEKLEQVKRGEIAPAQNNGVIGVRIWEEKESKWIPEWHQPYEPLVINNNYFYNNSPLTSQLKFASGGYFTGAMQCVISGCAAPIANKGMFLYSGGLSSGNMFNRKRRLYNCDTLYVGEGCDSNNLSYATSYSNGGIIPNYTRQDVNQFGELRALTEGELILSKDVVPNFQLGTTWGKQQEDKVVKVIFNKADTYIDLEIFYLTREEMVRIGIDFEKSKKVFVSGFPKAFGDKEQYCKIPSDWRKE